MILSQYAKKDRLAELLGLADANSSSRLPWPLPNMEEVDQFDFWWHCSSWGVPQGVWFQQTQDPDAVDGRKWFTPQVFLVDHSSMSGGGFAVTLDYSAAENWSRPYRFKRPPVRYYRWSACKHDYASRATGNCLTEYRCKKCGHTYEVDSSG